MRGITHVCNGRDVEELPEGEEAGFRGGLGDEVQQASPSGALGEQHVLLDLGLVHDPEIRRLVRREYAAAIANASEVPRWKGWI